MQKTKKKTEFKFIALRVGFLLALIFVVLLPGSLAYFSDRTTTDGDVSLKFGTVSIGITPPGENTTYLTVPSSAEYEGIYPNQNIAYTFDLKNQSNNYGNIVASNVDIYSIYGYEIRVLYGETENQEDITSLLSTYITINETSEITYVNEENKVIELTSQNPSITIAGNIHIEKTLPNEVENKGEIYYFNRKTRVINGVTYTKADYPPIQFVLRFRAEAIQKDNNSAVDENGNTTISATALSYFSESK